MNTPKKNKTPFYPERKSKKKNDSGLLVSKGCFEYDDDIFAGGISLDLRSIIKR